MRTFSSGRCPVSGRGRFAPSTSAPAAAGCRIGWRRSATTPWRSIDSTMRSMDWARARHYPVTFAVVQADFDALPFAPAQFDLVVFNGSLHYSPDPAATLGRSASGCSCAGGSLVVMDSPMFCARRRRPGDGRRAAARVHRATAASTDVVRPGVGFLTFARSRRAWPRVWGCAAQFVPSRGPLGWRLRRQLARRAAAPRAGGVRRVGGAMIVLFNPLSTTPGKQPLPLSLMSLAAVLEGRGAVGAGRRQRRAPIRPRRSSRGSRRADARELVAAGGHRDAGAAAEPGGRRSARRVRAALPDVPIVWGGYFPTQHTDTVLHVAVCRLRRALAGRAAAAAADRRAAIGAAARDASAACRGRIARRAIVHNPQRPMTTLDELPDLPYHRVDDGALHPPDLSRAAHGRAQLVVRLSVRLQLLRGRRDVEPALAGAVAGAHGARHAASGRRPTASTPCRCTTWTSSSPRRAPRSSPSASRRSGSLVGARPRRHADAVLATRRGATMARSGLKMVFSGAESGIRRSARAMNKGGKASARADARARARGCDATASCPSSRSCSARRPIRDGDVAHDLRVHPRASSRSTRRPKSSSTPTRRCRWTAALYDEARGSASRFPTTLEEWASRRVAAAVDAPRRRHPVDATATSAAASATSSACSTRSTRRSPTGG